MTQTRRGIRSWRGGIGLALIAAWLLALPASAAAQASNPLSPGFPQGQSPTTTTTAPTPALPPTTTTSTSGGGLSGGSAIAIAVGALIILGGISAFIWRDARRRAPVRARAAGADPADARRAGSKQRAKPRKLSPAERRRRKRGRAR